MLGTGTTETRSTEFPTGSLSDFLNEMQAPKQEMEINEEEILRDVPDEESPIPGMEQEEEGTATLLDSFTTAQASELLVGIMDSAIPAGLALVAKTQAKDWQAEPEQRRTLQKGFKSYLDAKGLDLPPGWLLLFLVLSIYGIKVPSAIAVRKQNQLEEEQQRQIRKAQIAKKAATKNEETPKE